MAEQNHPIVAVRDGAVRTSSRDVAAVFKKDHRNVLRDIDALLKSAPDLAPLNFEQGSYTLPETGSQQHRCFYMDRKGFTLLAMGFNGQKALVFKVQYIDAFDTMEAELRARPAIDPMKMLNDPSAMRGLLLTYSEKVIALEAARAEMAPKVKALDRIATADGSLCITDAAKTLQVRPIDLFKFLRQNKWIFKRPGSAEDRAYEDKRTALLLEHKLTTITKPDGSERVSTQVRVTPKGLARLAEIVPGAERQLSLPA